MSYSFNVRAASAAAAVIAATAKFDEVVESQPVHESDREAAIATVTAMTGLCGAPHDDQEVSVTVNGWLQWRGGDGQTPREFIGASLNVQAGLVTKEA